MRDKIPFYELTMTKREEHDNKAEHITAACSGLLKITALVGMFAVAIIYDSVFLYMAMGAGLIVLGISIKQVLDYKRGGN